MVITFGFDVDKNHFVPTHEPSMAHVIWIDTDVILPNYMSREFFINNYYKLTTLSRYGIDFNTFKTETQLRKFMELSGMDIYCAVMLLNTKRKTAFFTSTKAALNKWIDGKNELPHPWTGKQVKSLHDAFAKNFKSHHTLISKSLSPITSFA